MDSDKLHYRTELQQQAEARRRQLRIERDSRVQGEIEHVTRMSELWPPSNYQLKKAEVCVRACVCACVRVCVRACVRVCVCAYITYITHIGYN